MSVTRFSTSYQMEIWILCSASIIRSLITYTRSIISKRIRAVALVFFFALIFYIF